MPLTPISDSASRTSSSLNGLIMAVISFMRVPMKKSSVACNAQAGHCNGYGGQLADLAVCNRLSGLYCVFCLLGPLRPAGTARLFILQNHVQRNLFRCPESVPEQVTGLVRPLHGTGLRTGQALYGFRQF